MANDPDVQVMVASYGSRAEAEMMVELLLGEGIPAVARIDDAGGLRPELALGMGWAKVYVAEENKARAHEILENGGAEAE